VEFALAMPILLMLLLGVLDMGRGVLAAAILGNAVREGARAGAIQYPASGWDTTARDRTQASAVLVNPADLTLNVAAQSADGSTYVRVTSTYIFRPLAPYITVALSAILLQSDARMLVR
jgi:Flp pilus assembly protein TadG